MLSDKHLLPALMLRSLRPLIAVLVLAVTPACTNEDEIFNPEIPSTNFAAALGVDLANSTQSATGLWYRDISTGSGATVPTASGTRVTIQYTGWLRNGVEFDEGTFSFTTGSVGVGSAIPGVDEGVRDMNVGGVRQLIIPPELGYGRSGSGSIPGQSILVFEITLLSIG